MSWSIRDLDNDARKRAVEAAEHAGMSVDEWLSSLVRAGAGEPSPGRGEPQAPVRSAGGRSGARQPRERLRDSSAPAPRAIDKDNISEIASALDRLLAENARDGRSARLAKPQADVLSRSSRHERRAAAAEARATPADPVPSRRATDRKPERRGADVSPQERTHRVERVLAALGKLDERVRSLSASQSEPEGDERRRETTSQVDMFRSGRHENADHARERRRTADPAERDQTPRYERAPRSVSPDRRADLEPPAVFAQRRRPKDVDFEHHFRDLADRIDSLRDPHGSGFADLRQEISDLRHSIERRERDGTSDRDLGDITRLIASVERMQREAHDPHLAEEVRAEIADLRDVVMSHNIDGAMKTLESGYAHIVERLDDMRRQIQDPGAFSALEQRLDDIEQGLADIPRAGSFAAFDDRLDEMVSRLDGLSARGGVHGLDHIEREMRDLRAAIGELDVGDLVRNVDGQLRDFGDRLDAMAHGSSEDIHERLLAFEQRLPDRGILDTLNHRMERISSMLAEDRASSGDVSERVDERLGEILGRLERIERQGGNPEGFEKTFGLLETRIDSIAGKLDAIDGLPLDVGSLEDAITRIDAAVDKVGTDRLADLQSQIADIARTLNAGGSSDHSAQELSALREDVSALRKELTQSDTLAAAIEPQIQRLARSLVTDDRGTPDDANLQRIEQQIAVIAGQLDATEDRLSGLSDIEAALERIDSVVSGRAEGASEGRAATSGSDVAIDALRGDLSRLFEAAQDNRRESDDSMEKVQAVLNDIVDRLAGLENDAEVEGAMGYAEIAVGGGGGRAGRVAMGHTPRSPRSRRHDEVPDLAEDDDEIADLSTVEDVPLEPGSGKPDLAALLRAQAAEGRKEAGGDRKADFIAAARRAAQAAAAEVASESSGAPREKKDRGAWLRDRLKRSRPDDQVAPVSAQEAAERGGEKTEKKTKAKPDDRDTGTASGSVSRLRRPLVFAAAAVILTIGALKVATMFEPAPQAPAPVAENEIAPAPLAQNRADATGMIANGGDAVAPAPSSIPDKAVTFEPPASAPGGLRAPGAVQPFGHFDATPPRTADAGSQASRIEVDAPAGVDAAGGQNETPGARQSAAPSAPRPDAAVGPLALRMAASDGNPRAQFEVALRYTEGKGVPADLAKAAQWYQRAAEGGLAPAQYRLGSFYEKGRGLQKDLGEARKWYQRAAEQGNVKAMHNLAVLLADGGLGKPDFDKAGRWFQKAAERGVRDSQFNLGVLYARGLGVPRDIGNSYKWFAIAAKLGDSDAATKRDEIANSMPEAQLAEARKAVNTWKQKTVDEAVNTVLPDATWKDKPAGAAAAGNNLVMQAQLLLSDLGFDPGPADGVAGPKTVDAIRMFQIQAGLPIDGAIDKTLIRTLAGRSI